MNLGKCPICREKIEIYKSLDIDDWKRYDLKCNTDGCLINALEWQYEDREVLISIVRESQRLATIRPDKPVKKAVINKIKPVKKYNGKIHYHWKGEKTACGHGKSMTKTHNDVTCGLCIAHERFINDLP